MKSYCIIAILFVFSHLFNMTCGAVSSPSWRKSFRKSLTLDVERAQPPVYICHFLTYTCWNMLGSCAIYSDFFQSSLIVDGTWKSCFKHEKLVGVAMSSGNPFQTYAWFSWSNAAFSWANEFPKSSGKYDHFGSRPRPLAAQQSWCLTNIIQR